MRAGYYERKIIYLHVALGIINTWRQSKNKDM